MSSSRVLILILILPIFIHLLITPNHAEPICTDGATYCWDCSNNGNYSPNSIYKENLDNLLTSISSSSSSDQNFKGFYNTSLGQNPNTVNAIALCRGHLTPDNCSKCLKESKIRLLQNCPNSKEAILWDERCMLRYSSNSSIFSVVEDEPSKELWSPDNTSNAQQHEMKLKALLNKLIEEAAAGDSKYANRSTTVPNSEPIYALLQCTPNLSQKQCNDCLTDATLRLQKCCYGKQGVRILKPSCNLRYERGPFLDSNSALQDDGSCSDVSNDPSCSSVSPPSPTKGGSKTIRTVVSAVVPTVIAVMLIGICIFLKLRKPAQKLGPISEEIRLAQSLLYDFGTIGAVTDNFSEQNKLGEGGFGAVYKGRLPDGQYIAVKRLSRTSNQGVHEFKNEVELVAKLQHRNLVRLLGFCVEGRERILVYEYVANSSLDRFIFDSAKRAHLDWYRRYKIIQGIVRGLLYLHEDSRLRIIHRDLKASNILLDEEMNSKISDFGMARLFVFDQTHSNTNRIVGTYGYMAPEYAMHGQFSIKSDVYSFGVLLLEIVSGQKNSYFGNREEVEIDLLTNIAWENWMNGTASSLIDPAISTGSTRQIMRCMHIGLLCVQENITDRPTMNSVDLMLNSYSLTLGVPSKPAFFMSSTVGQNMFSMSNTPGTMRSDAVQGSINEASITDFYPR